jgi:hypothetical protein
MSILNIHERKILTSRLMQISSVRLQTICIQLTGDNGCDWVLNERPIVVAMKIIGWIQNDSRSTIWLCDELVLNWPLDTNNPSLVAISDRLKQQIAQESLDPTKEQWIGSMPVVNRNKLRSLLKNLVDGYDIGVVYIAGGPMSGRSHSFQLIRHVARQYSIACKKVDFDLSSGSRTLGHIYDRLHEVYDLSVIERPSDEGATPGDVADKFASRLRSRLVASPPMNPKPWVVIDYSAEVPDPAVPEFLRMLCAARDANEFDNSVIFVLGTTAHLETMRTQLFTLEVEELEDVNENDIRECAIAVNQRGIQPFEDALLMARVMHIHESVQRLTVDARWAEVRRELVKLRREVKAP